MDLAAPFHSPAQSRREVFYTLEIRVVVEFPPPEQDAILLRPMPQ